MPGLPESSRIGRVALAVADLDRVADFYADVVGLKPLARGDGRATLGAGGRPLLVLRDAPDAPARPRNASGLFHLAVRVPGRAALADALGRVRERWTLSGASDHLVSEALYLADPEGNGLEVYRDRPRERWDRDADGHVRMDTRPLDLDALAAESTGAPTVPRGTDVGHVHLEVTDLDRARAFYVDALGFDVSADWRGALFVAAGDYHHHVGLNTWNRRTEPSAGRGLDWFEVVLPDGDALDAAVGRLRDGGYDLERTRAGAAVEDPDGVELRLVAGG